jgi:hypothetical protein
MNRVKLPNFVTKSTIAVSSYRVSRRSCLVVLGFRLPLTPDASSVNIAPGSLHPNIPGSVTPLKYAQSVSGAIASSS